MSFLPIVERELRVAGRRRSTYRARFYTALGMLGMWLFLILVNWGRLQANLGGVIFINLGALALLFALLAGVFLTADTLSEEKREETLGLLFLTDLRGHDVVLGKLAATSLHAIYGLLAILPILGLPLLLGGVTGGAFWRVTLVLVATLFLSLSLGLLVSAVNREARQAMVGTLFGLVVLAGILPALYWGFWLLRVRTGTDILVLPSPVFAFISALDMKYGTRTGALTYWRSLEIVAGLAVVFLAAAAFLLPRVWQAKASPRVERAEPVDLVPPLIADFASRRYGAGLQARVARGLHPFLWLASRRPAMGTAARVLGGTLLGLWFCFLVASPIAKPAHEPFIITMFIAAALHIGFKVALAMEASRQLSEDRQSGALELLLVTPLPERDILAEQALALWKRFAVPAAVLVGVNLVLVASVVFGRKKLGMSDTDVAIFTEIFLGGILLLATDFAALVVVGMWQALRANRHHRAVLGTLGRVMLPAWLAMFVVVFVLNSLRTGRASEVALVFGCWYALGAVLDLAWCGVSWAQLRGGIRAQVTVRASALES